jgi:hypothetical protein
MSAVFTEHHHSLQSLILAMAEGHQDELQEFRSEVTESTVLCLSDFCMPITADCEDAQIQHAPCIGFSGSA